MQKLIRISPVFAGLLVLVVIAAYPQQAQARSIFSFLFGSPDYSTQAKEAVRAGDYAAAAELFLRAANEDKARESPGNRAHLLLRAAESAVLGGRNGLAARTLEQIEHDELPANERERVTLVRADLGQYKTRPRSLLQDLPPPRLNIPLWARTKIWKLRAQAYFQLGRTADGVHALVQREVGLLDDNAIAANRQLIWEELSRNASKVNASTSSGLDQTTRGWLDLASIMNTYWLGPKQMQQAIAEWQQRYPDHPAIQSVLKRPPAQAGSNASNNVSAPLTASSYQPDGNFDTVALLLPLSGPLATIGATVRDGFFAAYYQLQGQRPSVRVFDTGGTQANFAQLLDRVYKSRADAIVGPLTKAAVANLAAAQPQLPVLTLNYLDNFQSVGGQTRSSNFYQFGLLPEDEALQVAQRAVAAGHLRALVLTPQDEWGSRMFDAFRDAMQALGGQVVDFRFYQQDSRKYGDIISDLLQFNAAAARAIDTARQAGNPVEALPAAIRQDADFIFLAARPDAARLLLPQLRYYRATHLPIYATSSIYNGQAQPIANADLDGVVFCDIPWLLTPNPQQADSRQQLDRLWPQRPAALLRLYALGMDAFNLINDLHITQLGSQGSWAGATGSLQNTAGNRLRRTLEWARFVNGRVVPAPLAAPAPTPTPVSMAAPAAAPPHAPTQATGH